MTEGQTGKPFYRRQHSISSRQNLQGAHTHKIYQENRVRGREKRPDEKIKLIEFIEILILQQWLKGQINLTN